MASRSIWGATLTGAAIGTSAALLVLLVPVIGIRRDPDHLILYWQEMALYISCLAVSAVAGARFRYRAAKEYQQFLEGGGAETEAAPAPAPAPDTAPNVALNMASHTVPSVVPQLPEAARTEAGDADLDAQIDNLRRDQEPEQDKLEKKDDEILTEPPIEASLAGGPKKRRLRLASSHSKVRTLVLAILLYLILFVKCALLCQRLRLGVIIMDPVSEEMLRSLGLGVTIAGLYLATRGLFVSPVIDVPVLDKPDTPNSRAHVPPTRIRFLRHHPVCTGWLVILSGLPLVYQAWFPLLAIPGIFVAMNWMFPSRKNSQFSS